MFFGTFPPTLRPCFYALHIMLRSLIKIPRENPPRFASRPRSQSLPAANPQYSSMISAFSAAATETPNTAPHTVLPEQPANSRWLSRQSSSFPPNCTSRASSHRHGDKSALSTFNSSTNVMGGSCHVAASLRDVNGSLGDTALRTRVQSRRDCPTCGSGLPAKPKHDRPTTRPRRRACRPRLRG